jgi:hypothetical protein
VWERVRDRGRERELHGAANSSVARRRDADGAKRGRSFEADFRGGGDHQQFFIATFRAIQRAGGRDSDNRRDDDARSGLEPQRSVVLGIKRSGLQR